MSIVAVVDTDTNESQSVSALLAAMDVEAKLFASGESFFDVDPCTPACVIVDLHLRDMNGLEFLRRLRASGSTAPVVLLASEPDVPTAVEAMRLGAADFIEKSQIDVVLPRRITQVLRDSAAHA